VGVDISRGTYELDVNVILKFAGRHNRMKGMRKMLTY
jgi:hypothetical protein